MLQINDTRKIAVPAPYPLTLPFYSTHSILALRTRRNDCRLLIGQGAIATNRCRLDVFHIYCRAAESKHLWKSANFPCKFHGATNILISSDHAPPPLQNKKPTDAFALPFLPQEPRQSLSISSHPLVSIRPISHPSVAPHAFPHSAFGVRFRSQTSRWAPRGGGPVRLQAETP